MVEWGGGCLGLGAVFFASMLLLMTVPPALPQQADAEQPLFRMVWPQDGERIPAGWVELLYAVRPQSRPTLSFAVLLDGEPIHGAGETEAGYISTRRFPAVALGRIPVWIEHEGECTLTILQQEDQGGHEPEADIEAEAERQQHDETDSAQKCNEHRADKEKNLTSDGNDADVEAISQWSHGSVSVTVLMEGRSSMGVYLLTPFPGQVLPSTTVPVSYQVFPAPSTVTTVRIYFDALLVWKRDINCLDMRKCDAVEHGGVHLSAVPAGSHIPI